MTNSMTALAPNGAPLESKCFGKQRSPRVAAEIIAQEMCHTEAEWISITILTKHKDDFIRHLGEVSASFVLALWDEKAVVLEDDPAHRSFFFHKKSLKSEVDAAEPEHESEEEWNKNFKQAKEFLESLSPDELKEFWNEVNKPSA